MIDELNNSDPVTLQTYERYMSRCLQLATYGQTYVAPNPMVGAVIVCDGQIIGEGYHHKYGQAHAEPNAIRSVKNPELLKRSTLYVNLEPCSHYGKTPPCANLIVQTGIPKVVIGTLDPNPKVAGRGVKIMQTAGIEVVSGVLENKCRDLNKRFFIFQEEKRPFVLIKWAQTKDGYIDKLRDDSIEKPLRISNDITCQLTHKMRSENQSILVSTNTVIMDNPSLTVRYWAGRNPVRISIDRQGRIPADRQLFDGQTATIIFTTDKRQKRENLEFIDVDFDNQPLKEILKKIYEKNIHSVMVEGGAQLLNSFIDQGLWDEANIEISDSTAGSGIKAPVIDITPSESHIFENHQWLHYINIYKKFG
jgi:diaminohydroxyphosphoribosylaminopyrimidine deaminase/5-amino-6-(5-phosphoribosylamino)uracil reductase